MVCLKKKKNKQMFLVYTKTLVLVSTLNTKFGYKKSVEYYLSVVYCKKQQHPTFATTQNNITDPKIVRNKVPYDK